MSTNTTIAALLALAALAGAAGGVWHLSQGTQRNASGPAQEVPPPNSTPPAVTGMLQADPRVTPVRDPRDASRMTRLPDGRYVANLNGIEQPLTWAHPSVGFSPILRVEKNDQGREWWIHENGMKSTIFMAEGTSYGVPFQRPILQIAFPMDKTYPVAPVGLQEPAGNGKKQDN